jgi:phenylalanyl-tRNA synthetase beta chain
VPGFHPDHNVIIHNPLSSDLNVLRQSLLFGGLESVQYNQNRQASDLKMFEFGTAYQLVMSAEKSNEPLKKYSESTYLSLVMTGRKEAESWNTIDTDVDFFYLKAAVEQVIKRLGIGLEYLQAEVEMPSYFEYGLNYSKEGKMLISMGRISKEVLEIFDIRQAVFYADLHWDNLFGLIRTDDKKYIPVSRYPEVRRDLALLVAKEVSFGDIKKLVEKTDKQLIQEVNLFDVYEGDKIEEGKKSYAISIILQDREKTLTDKVVDKIIHKAITSLQKELGAIIR